jgi:uncharacterized protein
VKSAIVSLAFLVLWAWPLSLEASQEEAAVEMALKNIVLDPLSQAPVVLLESSKEKKPLPIWIGVEEATSIALEMKKISLPRPNTHDLIRNILQGVGAAVQRITITDVRNDIYYARIAVKLKGQDYQIDSRPSDAIAVALRMKAPIYASVKVLDQAKQLGSPKSPSEAYRNLGIQAQDLTPELASLFDLNAKAGILVADVEPGSAAAQAGLQRGDVILKVNEKSLQKTAELESFIQTAKKGEPFKLEVLRKGKTTTIVLNLPS